MRKLIKQQAIVWFALLGVLFGTLAPTVSHAMAPGPPATLEMQICSSAGMVTMTVALDDASAPAGAGAMTPFEHCPYCSQHANFPALLPERLAMVSLPLSQADYPARFYQSATPQFAWSGSSPRGPPAQA
ncbi:DUF2946 domain-containing protein [Massilia sp. HP4]|uniref:DUF2946 domain-containing protein n=1 Tax=Massilia sp. HP4 TaxID=2562316 RepID=UPI001485A21D|nr:DUF2946 domain-containing protein [Massilia sp. HP4]